MDALFKTEAEELNLKPIQEDMVDQLRNACRRNKRVILMAGTGLGKTIIATHVIKSAVDKGNRCLFVNDRRQLVAQTSEVFDRFGVDHGIIMGNDPRYAPALPVQVGSVQTLQRRKIEKYDLIVVDEAHTIYKGHKALLKANPEALIIGLTATPFSKGLGKIFDTFIEPYPLRTLIDQGYLCDFEIYGPETYDLSKVKTVAGEYHGAQLEEAVNQGHLVADVVDTYLKLGKGRKTICFTQSVAHGRSLVREFQKKGIKAAKVDTYMSDEDRAEAMQGFVSGNTEVMCSVEILIKGFDLTTVDCVVWATATKSPIKWIQGTGRGLRYHPGKEMCRVIDHGSNCQRLGSPDDFAFFSLDDGKQNEAGKQEKERAEKKPKRCPSCDFMKPAGIVKCPACGLVPEYAEKAETVDGKLVKYDLAKRKGHSKQYKQDFYAGLLSYAIWKGYKPGWAAYKYRAKFGVMPFGCKGLKPGEITPEIRQFIVQEQIKWAKSKK